MAYRAPGEAGPPAWLIVLVAAMLVFGGYFIWTGLRTYLSGAFVSFTSPTEVATLTVDEAAQAAPTLGQRFTPVPSRTSVPACQDFVVIVPEAIVRECASTSCAIAGTRREGAVVCVLERDYADDEWYIVDLDDSQFFTSIAYMHESLMRPLNPTLTHSITNTPLPTLTPAPSQTPLPTPQPTATPATAIPPSITPTFTPSPTPPLVTG